MPENTTSGFMGRSDFMGRLYAVRRRAAYCVSGFYVRGKLRFSMLISPAMVIFWDMPLHCPAGAATQTSPSRAAAFAQARKPRRSYAVVVGNKYVKAFVHILYTPLPALIC